ncbi:MAG: hypothetical protein H6565_07785 [Lewinellaceae bacterium]|nr:hypothetical protein [Lewinellaceae bacterium]
MAANLGKSRIMPVVNVPNRFQDQIFVGNAAVLSIFTAENIAGRDFDRL